MTTPPPTDPGEQTSSWKDAARPVSERVDLLLAEMTLEEKLAQLGSRWLRSDMPSRWLESDMPSRWLENDMPQTGGALNSPDGPEPEHGETLNVAPMQEAFANPAPFEEAGAHGMGHLTRPLGTSPIDPVSPRESVRATGFGPE